MGLTAPLKIKLLTLLPLIPPVTVLVIPPFTVSVAVDIANLPAVNMRLLLTNKLLPRVVIVPLWLMVKLFKALVVPAVVVLKKMDLLKAPFNTRLLAEEPVKFLPADAEDPPIAPSKVRVLLPITNLLVAVPAKVSVPLTLVLPCNVLV